MRRSLENYKYYGLELFSFVLKLDIVEMWLDCQVENIIHKFFSTVARSGP